MKKGYLISSSEIFDVVDRNGKGLGFYIEPLLKRRAMRAIRMCCENETLDKPTAADFVAYIMQKLIPCYRL